MNFRKFLSVFLALIMIVTVPVTVNAETDCMVEDNVIDITDRDIYTRSNRGSAKVTNINITGVDVESATEDNTTINIVLNGNTQSDATISIVFGTALDKNFSMSGHDATVALTNGEASVDMVLKGQYSNFSSWSGTVTYTLNFSLESISPYPPERLVETDNKSTYSGVALDINLKDYFENAKTYYLVDGDKKTVIDGKIYKFKSFVGGMHTLVFSASNDNGECSDFVTVIIDVTEIKSGVWLGITTSNGSLNFVRFKDINGDDIDGLTATMQDKNIIVTIPRDFDANGKINAVFDLTQTNDLPFITTKTGTSGTSSGKAVNNKFTEKTTTLSNGEGELTFYLYNSVPSNTNNVYSKYTINYVVENEVPVLATQEKDTTYKMVAGETYSLDISHLFTDEDQDELTYKVSINGSSFDVADADYTFTTDVAGTYTLVFTANDGKDDSEDTYTVILTVENSALSDLMTVYIPEGLNPLFYVASGFENGMDILGDALSVVEGSTTEGMTCYTVNYPVNADMISVRTEEFGGMAFSVQKDRTVSFRKAVFSVVDYDNNNANSINSINYGDTVAVSGVDGWLLLADCEYVFTATPEKADLANNAQTITIEPGADIYVAQIMLGIKNPMSITVPTGAKAQLYKFNQYYSNTEIDAKIIIENDNGTTTYQFIADTKANGASYIYRVSMEGKITKSGWLSWGQQNLTVNYTEDDKTPEYRPDYLEIGERNSTVAEDSVLLNINSRNHLNLSVGQTKTLKAYRAWEIIPKSYQNYIISPDFTYTILQGSDVVSLTEKASPSAGVGDWMTLTALKDGIAVIEVTYDAIEVSGGDYDGIYGASDPARTGLLIVQIGESDDSTVKFGIDSFTSIGNAGSKNITYNANNKKEWDVEFDTLYFLGNNGELTLTPVASTAITEVSVSNDKGVTWTTLNGENGVYTAQIVQGNNIIRVTTESGTAYQVVRGDKVSLKLVEVSDKSNSNGIIEAGETIRVNLIGLHNPIPKMSGNYNPGYIGNTAGYSSQHLNYTCNGNNIYGPGMQYNFITSANYVEIVMPDDGSNVTLTDGYIALGVIGLNAFFNGGDSHRNIPDGGCSTRGDQTTYHTRSILPDIILSDGDSTAPNSAPIVRGGAITESSIYDDQNFAINPDILFLDADDDAMTFTVSVNGAEATDAPLDYKFIPNGVGVYTLLFTATDGKETAQHTITLTVTNRPSQGGPSTETDDKFGLSASEIAGYVTISFVDKGVRVTGETGLKYPKALGTIIPSTKVPFKNGEKITHVTKRLLDSLEIRMSYTGTLENGFYLGAICNFELNGTPYSSFGEFDAGVGSGWMITLNKTFIEYGASEFEVKNGDVIKWQYTCQLGKDIGDPFYSSSKKSNKTENVKEEDVKEEEKVQDEEPKEEVKNTFTPTTFKDVKEDEWHYEAVKYVYENNIMQGTGDGFEPESKMTRAMLVTVLFRMTNPEIKENSHSFADVPENEWYKDAVSWASETGIVNGVSDTEFAPCEYVTREQMALIIYRYAKMLMLDVETDADISKFEDLNDVSDWALDAMKWANNTELVNGTSETTLSPKDTATRAQVAAILMRFCENAEK